MPRIGHDLGRRPVRRISTSGGMLGPIATRLTGCGSLILFLMAAERHSMTTDRTAQFASDGGQIKCSMCFGYGYLESNTFGVLGGKTECFRCDGTGFTDHGKARDANPT